jgi:glyceraldehyde 3-phosphate dehydrogenase
MLAHLLKYDSTHGVLADEVTVENGFIKVGGKVSCKVVGERDPSKLPWKELGVELVVECTGSFTEKEGASKHVASGAKKVLISAPAKGVDCTIVMGVNQQVYDPAKHSIISMGSCTTNCLAPVAKTLNDAFGIEKGFMVTTHAYTHDQNLMDAKHRDLRRARSAALSIIPTTTGAAKAIEEVIPELKGKLDGLALRVPVPCGSVNDLTCVLSKSVSAKEVNEALKAASEGKLKGIMEYSEAPLVSSDIVGNPHSAVVDGLSTMVIKEEGDRGTMAKVLAWYDNEWAYSTDLKECAEFVAEKG